MGYFQNWEFQLMDIFILCLYPVSPILSVSALPLLPLFKKIYLIDSFYISTRESFTWLFPQDMRLEISSMSEEQTPETAGEERAFGSWDSQQRTCLFRTLSHGLADFSS